MQFFIFQRDDIQFPPFFRIIPLFYLKPILRKELRRNLLPHFPHLQMPIFSSFRHFCNYNGHKLVSFTKNPYFSTFPKGHHQKSTCPLYTYPLTYPHFHLFYRTRPPGFEPGITVPKTVVISISPRAHRTLNHSAPYIFLLLFRERGYGLVAERVLAKDEIGVRFSVPAFNFLH